LSNWYYFDMKRAVTVEDDREDAVLSIPEDKQVRVFGGNITLDVTTPEREYEADLFPANRTSPAPNGARRITSIGSTPRRRSSYSTPSRARL
jgi:hypothetical protein